MRARFIGSLLALLCLSSLCACGSEPRPFPEWPTPVPPNYRLVQAAGWEDLEIRTICLTVDQTYNLGGYRTEPVPEELYEDEPTEAATRGALEILGIEVVPAGSACDASLTLVAAFTPLSARYRMPSGSSRSCYGGARLDLDASLSAPERPTLTCPATISNEPGDALRSCYGLEDAPFKGIWQDALTDSMLCAFGSSAYCPILIHVWNRSAIRDPKINLDEAAVSVPCLVEQLRHPDPWIRRSSAKSLSWLGPRAKASVPYLLQIHLEEEDVGWATGALKEITGVGWKKDVDDVVPGSMWAQWTDREWVQWWNAQDPDDWGF